MYRLGFVCALVGCSTDATVSIDAPGDHPMVDAAVIVDSPSGVFAVTSPVLAPGGAIAMANACAGANTSPQLDWANAPAGAASFAVVLTDKSNNLVHSVIYDIPMTATGLPAGVEKVYAPANVAGAHQTLAYDNATRGYLGPCPPSPHMYEFAVYGLGTSILPLATMNTTRAQAVAEIQDHVIVKATLVGTYTP